MNKNITIKQTKLLNTLNQISEEVQNDDNFILTKLKVLAKSADEVAAEIDGLIY